MGTQAFCWQCLTGFVPAQMRCAGEDLQLFNGWCYACSQLAPGSEVSDAAARTWRVEADAIVRSTAVASLASGLQWGESIARRCGQCGEGARDTHVPCHREYSPGMLRSSNWRRDFFQKLLYNFVPQ